MIRGITILWILLAMAASVGLFLLKYDVSTMEERLARLNRTITADRGDIHVLEAEWTYLNTPARLRRLAATYLPSLRPLTANQFTPLGALSVLDLTATPSQETPPKARPTPPPTARPVPRPTSRRSPRRAKSPLRLLASKTGSPRLTARFV